MSRADCDACDEFYTKNREQARIYRESSEAANRIIEQQMKEIASLQAELVKKDKELSKWICECAYLQTLQDSYDKAYYVNKNQWARIFKVEEEQYARIHALEQQILTRDCQLREKEQEICKWIEDRDIWIKRYEAVNERGMAKEARSEELEGYISRLEAAFIQSDLSAQYHASMRFGMNYTEEQMQKKVKDALEKLRKS